VATWRGPYDAVEYRGEIYGLRVHEFRPLLALAGRVDECLCIALDIDPADEADVAALDENGWRVADPIAVAGRPEAYRTFIQASKAEISVAKGVYVGTKCGWFSDRSACYLAGGRPVVAQDTGFSEHLPTGRGLMAFRTIDEAANAIEEVSRDWQAHSKAARAIAEEYFDARVVLQRILDVAGI
jgi:hypothetical protein